MRSPPSKLVYIFYSSRYPCSPCSSPSSSTRPFPEKGSTDVYASGDVSGWAIESEVKKTQTALRIPNITHDNELENVTSEEIGRVYEHMCSEVCERDLKGESDV